MCENINQLIETIGQRNPLQRKYFENSFLLSDEEITELNQVIDFFNEDYSIEKMAEAYLLFVEDTLNETKYFTEVRGERYRYKSLNEVNDKVYQNEQYMNKYMLGLMLSGYLWDNHRKIHQWFKKQAAEFSGHNFLEIGPGHGMYFTEMLNLNRFEKYFAIDLSDTSLKMTERFIRKFAHNKVPYELICNDVYSYAFDTLFDGVVISEVLEHVENPDHLLNIIYNITSQNADIYVNVPINAPAIDHIFLFSNIDEVKSIIDQNGFRIIDQCIVTGNNKSIERAIQKKYAINYAFRMKKK